MKSLAPALLVLAGCVNYRPYPMQEPPLTRPEAERLAAAGISEPVMIELAEKRGALKLSADDLVALKTAGASDAVVQKMITHERKEPVVYYVDDGYCPVYHHHSSWCYPSFGLYYSRSYSSGHHHRSRGRWGWGFGFGW